MSQEVIMAKINENKLAARIANLEAGRTSVNIAQIKEVLKIALDLLAEEYASDALALIEKHQ